MRTLLDTHAFLWWISDSRRLSAPARRAIEDDANTIFVSAASAWEITTKHRIGKLAHVEAVALDMTGSIAGQGFEELAITVDDAARAGRLPAFIATPSTGCSSLRPWHATWPSCPWTRYSTDTVSTVCGSGACTIICNVRKRSADRWPGPSR